MEHRAVEIVRRSLDCTHYSEFIVVSAGDANCLFIVIVMGDFNRDVHRFRSKRHGKVMVLEEGRSEDAVLEGAIISHHVKFLCDWEHLAVSVVYKKRKLNLPKNHVSITLSRSC